MSRKLFNKKENKEFPHFTAEQHLVLEGLLQDVHDWSTSLSVLLATTYGKNSKVKVSVMNVVKALRGLKSTLNDVVCKEFEDEDINGVDTKTVYFAKDRIAEERIIDNNDRVWSARTMYARKNTSD